MIAVLCFVVKSWKQPKYPTVADKLCEITVYVENGLCVTIQIIF